ncbi:MAG TPA: hypothetical protein VGC42_02925 [Kofleriaceae bacterium]
MDAGGFSDDKYEQFLAAVRARFAATCAAAGPRPALLRTGATGLFDLFLAQLPPVTRQVNTCATCRAFFDQLGAMVRADDDGVLHAALWDAQTAPEPYAAAVRAVARAVTAAPIAAVVVSSATTWGTPSKGGPAEQPWTHLAVTPPAALVYTGVVRTAAQVAAERREDRGTLVRGLEEFSPEVVRKAVALLKSDRLYRSEKCLGVAEWLLGLHAQREAVRDKARRDNLMWRAAASAPPGFCHVRSTMIGTLLEDLASHMAFDTVKQRFAAKMHPLQYQRPTAAPSAQNIARAEEIIGKLRSAGALERRFARLDDIVALWRPRAPEPAAKKGGVFSHLMPKGKASGIELDAPPTVITWDKFSRTVLPDAVRITYAPPADRRPYMAYVTAANREAPPILQWDAPERRNPVSLYLYVNGSLPADWNLEAGTAHAVTAITLDPPHWYSDGFAHHTQVALFVLEGARDLAYKSGAGFFPEQLRNEYHEIRKTIEAYAKSAIVAERDQAEVCGLALQKGQSWNYTFHVTGKDQVTQAYTLDRWD